MAATHSLAMELLRRTKRTDYLPQMEGQGNLAVKLLRTYTAPQIEALAKLRRKGEQTVRVEHVHVHGGQNIFGDVNPQGGGRDTAKWWSTPRTQRSESLLQAPRCGARTRAGTPCQSPAVNGKTRCRMHGGAKDSGGPKGNANGRYAHGRFTCEAVESRRELQALIRGMREFAAGLSAP